MTAISVPARNRRHRRVSIVLLPLIAPVVAVVLWWVLSRDNTSPFYPSLKTILQAFRENWLFARFGSDVVPSLVRMLGGYCIAVIVGIGLGLVFGRIPLLLNAFNPALQFLRALPATALVPVSIVLMGIGNTPKISLIAFVTLFPVLLNTIDGVRNVDPVLEDVSRSFRLTRAQRLLHVHLPAAAPQILAGMRIALSVAFVLMIVTELVAATEGIGYVTLQAQQSFQIPLMWSGMLLLGILGVLFNEVFVLLEHRLLRWYVQNQES